jgi:hypothetical protein
MRSSHVIGDALVAATEAPALAVDAAFGAATAITPARAAGDGINVARPDGGVA